MIEPGIQKRVWIERPKVANGIAFAWGLAEATLFFLVPDVWLTRLAVQDFRKAWVASLWALFGAILGGTVLWIAARQGVADGLFSVFDSLPGISPALIEKSGTALEEHGLLSLATGAMSGQPYKLYAVQAGVSGVAFIPFVLASLGARFCRFLLSSTLAWGIGRLLRSQGQKFLLRLHGVSWLIFYLWYFWTMRD
jgi:membrane protein YqaA with SNARE-associated domain